MRPCAHFADSDLFLDSWEPFIQASVKRRISKVPQGVRDEVSKSHRLAFDGFCPTMRAGTGSDRGRFQAVRPLHPTVDRVITPRGSGAPSGIPRLVSVFVHAMAQFSADRR